MHFAFCRKNLPQPLRISIDPPLPIRGYIYFGGATFGGIAVFLTVIYIGGATFGGIAVFLTVIYFGGANFGGIAVFLTVICFGGATFGGIAVFLRKSTYFVPIEAELLNSCEKALIISFLGKIAR